MVAAVVRPLTLLALRPGDRRAAATAKRARSWPCTSSTRAPSSDPHRPGGDRPRGDGRLQPSL